MQGSIQTFVCLVDFHFGKKAQRVLLFLVLRLLLFSQLALCDLPPIRQMWTREGVEMRSWGDHDPMRWEPGWYNQRVALSRQRFRKASYVSAGKWRWTPSQGKETKTGADTDAVTDPDPDPDPWYQLQKPRPRLSRGVRFPLPRFHLILVHSSPENRWSQYPAVLVSPSVPGTLVGFGHGLF